MKTKIISLLTIFLTLNTVAVFAAGKTENIALDEKKLKAYEDAKETEQSNANRLLTSASTAATGIGGMELAQGLSEQKADKAAEQAMSAYISTMRCSYGNGKSVKAGTEEIELPGGNNSNMMKYRTEYTALAADLKERKNALDMTPGIESEEILDKSQMGLYDDENVGINGGRYASLYRAQMLGSESDQAQLDEAKQTSKTRVIGGAVAAGVGVVGGIIGDELINQSLSSSTKTAQTCTESGGTWQGARCHCPDGFIQRTKTGPCFEEKTDIETTTAQQTQQNPSTPENDDTPVLNSSSNQTTDSADKISNASAIIPTNDGRNIDNQNALPNETKTNNVNPATAEYTFDDGLLEVEEAPSVPPEIASYEQEQLCRNFDGNWEDGQCFCTLKFNQNNYIKCINRQIGNGSTEVISKKTQVAGQELVPAEPVDNDFVWNENNINDSSADLSTPQAQTGSPAAAVGTVADKTETKTYSDTDKQDTNSNPRDNSNNQNDNENSQKIVSSQEDQKQQTQEQTCGVVGKKECNSNYYVCASDSDCTSDKLPANATAGHCWKSGSRSVCTATACKDTHEVSQGHCVKKKVVDRNTNAQKTNTSSPQRANNTGRTTQQNTNSNMVVGYNADGTCDIYKDRRRQTTDVSVCNGLSKSQWRSNGKQGISKCASNSDAFGKTAPEGDTGRDCWCKINNQKSWVYVGGTTFTKDCPTNCAYSCAYHYYEGAFK